MPIQYPKGFVPSESGTSPLEAVLCPSDHRKQVIGLIRRYLAGRRRVNLDTLRTHLNLHTLTETQWRSALPREPVKAKLEYRDPSDLEAVADAGVDPFDAACYRELFSVIESNLLTEDSRYFQAFLENERPKDVALELGIDPKTASRRMKEVRQKIRKIIEQLNREHLHKRVSSARGS
jgi:hypothetical protein